MKVGNVWLACEVGSVYFGTPYMCFTFASYHGYHFIIIVSIHAPLYRPVIDGVPWFSMLPLNVNPPRDRRTS